MEEACRLNVKWSLQELSKAINGDGKTAPNSLFKVNINSFYVRLYVYQHFWI